MSTPAPEAPVEEPGTPAPEAPVEPEKPTEETVTLSRTEADALRRNAAMAERKAKQLEAEQTKAAEKRKEEEGQHQELAEQRARELEQERAERGRVEREARITRLAGKQKFLDAADVVGRITAEEGQDDASVEAALERIAQQSPHLIAKESTVTPEIGQVLTPSATTATAGTVDGKPQPPAGKAPLSSLDEWEALPQTERAARMAEADWLFVHEK